MPQSGILPGNEPRIAQARHHGPDRRPALLVKKGSSFEDAVRSIESAILAGESLNGRMPHIEPRKIVTIRGVKQEIDILVRLPAVKGYDATFIFECKDWKKPVGPDQLAHFLQKIRATRATRGFFVARRFTKSAINLAAQYGRLQLLYSIDCKISPLNLKFSWPEKIVYTCHEVRTKKGKIIPAPDAVVQVGRRREPLTDLVRRLGDRVYAQRFHLPDVDRLDEGNHPLSALTKFTLPKGLVRIDGVAVHMIAVLVTFDYKVKIPAFRYGYDVKDRGMFVKFDRIAVTSELGFDSITLSPRGESPPPLPAVRP